MTLQRRVKIAAVTVASIFLLLLAFAVGSGMVWGVYGFLAGLLPFAFLAALLLLSVPLIPIALVWYGATRVLEKRSTDRTKSEPAPLDPWSIDDVDALKAAYARDEISEEAFEIRLEQLLDAEDRHDRWRDRPAEFERFELRR